jgi:hypothetical protein
VAERRGFGAPALRIGRDLDIGAGKDAAVLGAQRRSDRKFRIRRIGLGHGGLRRFEQIISHDEVSVP